MIKDPNKKHVEVCVTPDKYDRYKEYNQIVVVIDVLRATSAICTAFDYGVEKIIPVSRIEKALEYKVKGFIVAAERNGEIVAGFDRGNSPFGFMDDDLKGETVVLTTTNGTRAINIAKKNAGTVVIGSLLNLDVLCDWLIEQNEDVLLLCSGWRDKLNLEDTICAGAIAERLLDSMKFQSVEDSTIMAKYLFQSASNNYLGFLKASSHRRRLQKLNMNADIKYCLTPNQSRAIPILKGKSLVDIGVQESVRS
ncbi:MAG: 2-phosphosulfolactate phosphatase [Flavobacteriales bacterium]|nr:2-phosphosulfolactate phosphatase [Flavobacteriales bacterium]